MAGLSTLSLTEIYIGTNEADPLFNPLDICLTSDVQDAFKSIQWPNNIFNGELSVTIPSLRPGSKPDELSGELVNKFPKNYSLFEPPLIDGVHLRFFLKFDAVPRFLLPYILDRKNTYGNFLIKQHVFQKLVVEFSSPNITSEFQGENLRNTVIGTFIGRLYESMGWDVTRINYLGGWVKYGSEGAYEADPVGHLLQVYHRIEEEFKPEQAANKPAHDEVAKEGVDKGGGPS
ncbi:hypothetical protein GGP41_002523 [Bipolaris sorokiniana]|uniref:Arginyl-tRNA synthetase catalytic core domain-containing protein n=1 Tax=Cochliobolus sativus TaxID=45130 RepID=A0A8H5ZH14_COCSA|nr:hypothetical protein GGP41_002523 [Bipolaris sorokiniana]